jgi:hypothetical protein
VSKRTRQIANEPHIFKATNFKDLRVATLGHFSLYYKALDERIIFSAFWDNRQDPKKLLKILERKN